MTTKQKETKVKKVKRASTKIEGITKSQSAYILFCTEERQKLKESNPEMKSKDIVKQAAISWKELEANDPERYESLQQRASDDRARYLKEKEDYYTLNPHLHPKNKKAAKKEVVVEDEGSDGDHDTEEKAPKVKKERKINKFLVFQKVIRPQVKEENPEFTSKEVSAEISNRWKSLSDEEKEKYI